MIKNLISDLGFVFQFSGIMLLFPCLYAFLIKDIISFISLIFAPLIFLSLGFLFNVLSERKELNLKESFILLFLTYFFLSLIGSIPYLIYDIYFGNQILSKNIYEKIIDAFFESSSAFTTFGFSLLNYKNLPEPFIFYRSLSQFIGGINIIFILLTFIFSFKTSHLLTKVLGFEIKRRIKISIILVLLIYFIAISIFSFLLVYFEKIRIIDALNIAFTTFSTGGLKSFEYSNLSSIGKAIVIFGMIFGATNISIFIFEKFRKIAILELILLILFIFILSNFLTFENFIDKIFHSASILTTTGHSYLNLSFSSFQFFIFSVFALIGGSILSTAGGIKIARIFFLIKGIKEIIKKYIFKKEIALKDYELIAFPIFFFFVFFTVISALIFSYFGYSLEKSIFNSVSALSTVGILFDFDINSLPILKIWIAFLTIIGRIEIIPLILLFFKVSNKQD